MSERYGDLLVTKNSWSSNLLFSTFGLPSAPKAMMGIDEAGQALLDYLIPLQKWVYLNEAIDRLRAMVESASPTSSFQMFSGQLQQLWDEFNPLMEATPNEQELLANLLKSLKEDFKDAHGTVGCKKLKRSYIHNTCNLFKSF